MKTVDPDEQAFRQWRGTESRWRAWLPFAIAGAPVIIVFIVGVQFLWPHATCSPAPFLASTTAAPVAKLPSPNEVERELKIRCVAKGPALLRGRRLWQHKFTTDASQFTRRGADYSLWLNDEGVTVAFSATLYIIHDEELGEALQTVMRVDTPDYDYVEEQTRTATILGAFLARYVPRAYEAIFSNTPPPAPATPIEYAKLKNKRTATGSRHWLYNGFEIEVTLTEEYLLEDEDHSNPVATQFIVIIKSPESIITQSSEVLAETDGAPGMHDTNILRIAVDLASKEYVWSDSDSPVALDAGALGRMTSGLSHVSPPHDPGCEWRLTRCAGLVPPPRSFVRLQRDGDFARNRTDLERSVRFQTRLWQQHLLPGRHDELMALFDCAAMLWDADTNDEPEPPCADDDMLEITTRERNIYTPNWHQYLVCVTRRIGDYTCAVTIRDTPRDLEGPWCRVLVEFTYDPDQSVIAQSSQVPAETNDVPSMHDINIVRIAADLASKGYVWSGSDSPVGLDARALARMTCGLWGVSPPRDPDCDWCLKRDTNPLPDPWSFVRFHRVGDFASNDTELERSVRLQTHLWQRHLLPGRHDDVMALFDCAAMLWAADTNGEPEPPCAADGMLEITTRERSVYPPDWNQYLVCVTGRIGDYTCAVTIRDTPTDPDGPWCFVLVEFKHDPAPDAPLSSDLLSAIKSAIW